MAICTQDIAAIQSPGHGVHPAARHIWRRVSGEDRQYLVLLGVSSFLNQYCDRRRYENALMCLCLCAAGVQGSRRPGHVLNILHILYICHVLHIMHIMHLTLFDCCTAWLAACQSTIVYEQLGPQLGNKAMMETNKWTRKLCCICKICKLICTKYTTNMQINMQNI